MYSSRAKIWYNPSSPNTVYRKWWAVLLIPKNIVFYYQSMILKETGVKLATSSWGPHISFIRGEPPPYEEFWKVYNGEIVDFFYYPPCIPGNTHWTIPVQCKRLEDIRTELGLEPRPSIDFHITVGKIVS